VFKKILVNPKLFEMFTTDEAGLQEYMLDLLFSGEAKDLD